MTSNPVYDAEKAQEETRKPIAYCHFCKEPIYGADSTHYADTAFYDNDIWFCENCTDTYLEQFKINSEYGR